MDNMIKQEYLIEEDSNSYTMLFPAIGVMKEDIDVNFKGNVMYVFIGGNEFIKDMVYVVGDFGFKVKKQDIKVFTELGVLTVVVNKPEGYEFKVKVE